MLVFTRKKGESIIIDKNIKVTFARDLGNGAIRIGVEAPKHIVVDREEVHLDKNKVH